MLCPNYSPLIHKFDSQYIFNFQNLIAQVSFPLRKKLKIIGFSKSVQLTIDFDRNQGVYLLCSDDFFFEGSLQYFSISSETTLDKNSRTYGPVKSLRPRLDASFRIQRTFYVLKRHIWENKNITPSGCSHT